MGAWVRGEEDEGEKWSGLPLIGDQTLGCKLTFCIACMLLFKFSLSLSSSLSHAPPPKPKKETTQD